VNVEDLLVVIHGLFASAAGPEARADVNRDESATAADCAAVIRWILAFRRVLPERHSGGQEREARAGPFRTGRGGGKH